MHSNEIEPNDIERLSRKLSHPDARLTGRDRAVLIAALALAAAAIGGTAAVERAAAPASSASTGHAADAADVDVPISDQFRQSFIPGAVTTLAAADSVKLED